MKVIVAGGRDFVAKQKHKDWLIEQLEKLKATSIVCGMAKGADTFGKIVGEELGLEILKFPADWNKHGKAAGPIRNNEMAKVADACILFPGGVGTADIEQKAQHLIIIKWEEK